MTNITTLNDLFYGQNIFENATAVSSRGLYMTGASCGCLSEKEELGSRRAGGVFLSFLVSIFFCNDR